MEFGALLRKIRKAHNLSLDGLSILSGVHKSNLCKMESGDLTPPKSLAAFEKFVEKTGFSDMEKFDLLQAAKMFHLNRIEERFKRPHL